MEIKKEKGKKRTSTKQSGGRKKETFRNILTQENYDSTCSILSNNSGSPSFLVRFVSFLCVHYPVLLLHQPGENQPTWGCNFSTTFFTKNRVPSVRSRKLDDPRKKTKLDVLNASKDVKTLRVLIDQFGKGQQRRQTSMALARYGFEWLFFNSVRGFFRNYYHILCFLSDFCVVVFLVRPFLQTFG